MFASDCFIDVTRAVSVPLSDIHLFYDLVSRCSAGGFGEHRVVAPWNDTAMSVKLSPAIKHLLTLKNPNVPPAPSLSKLYGVLKSTYSDAKQKQATRGWLTLTVRSLSVV